jgi:hypothetical protein
VFADPGSSFCSFVCSGAVGADKTRLSKKYMTAWLNYYLRYDTGYYGYLYGAQAESDISSGLIARQVSTAPRGLTAGSQPGLITLTWQLYQHPMVAGYNVYRRLPGQGYSEAPYAQLGLLGAYTDTGVAGGQVYSNTVRSYDPAGSLHQAAREVSAAAPFVPTAWMYLPIVLKR